MARAATTADAFNAIAEPRRREILDVLALGERPVNDLVRELGLGQPQVSKHLRVLREVGAVEVRDEGRRRLYRLNGHALKPIHDWVSGYERCWTERFEALETCWTNSRASKELSDVMSSAMATVTLPSDEEILITREFDASRHLVFKAWTTPDLVRRWWTGHRGELTVCEIDLRVGGRWRYVMVGEGGWEVAFNGEFSELVPGERIVTSDAFEGMPDAEPALNIITFAESGDRTTLELLIRVKTKADRDMILGTGMMTGVQEQFELLDALASALR